MGRLSKSSGVLSQTSDEIVVPTTEFDYDNDEFIPVQRLQSLGKVQVNYTDVLEQDVLKESEQDGIENLNPRHSVNAIMEKQVSKSERKRSATSLDNPGKKKSKWFWVNRAKKAKKNK
jgi:hypothetical protein